MSWTPSRDLEAGSRGDEHAGVARPPDVVAQPYAFNPARADRAVRATLCHSAEKQEPRRYAFDLVALDHEARVAIALRGAACEHLSAAVIHAGVLARDRRVDGVVRHAHVVDLVARGRSAHDRLGRRGEQPDVEVVDDLVADDLEAVDLVLVSGRPEGGLSCIGDHAGDRPLDAIGFDRYLLGAVALRRALRSRGRSGDEQNSGGHVRDAILAHDDVAENVALGVEARQQHDPARGRVAAETAHPIALDAHAAHSLARAAEHRDGGRRDAAHLEPLDPHVARGDDEKGRDRLDRITVVEDDQRIDRSGLGPSLHRRSVKHDSVREDRVAGVGQGRQDGVERLAGARDGDLQAGHEADRVRMTGARSPLDQSCLGAAQAGQAQAPGGEVDRLAQAEERIASHARVRGIVDGDRGRLLHASTGASGREAGKHRDRSEADRASG